MSENTSYLPDRNLAMELVRVTEAAALASGRWVGRGQKNEGDGAAVDAMRRGARDFLQKPVNPDRLLSSLTEAARESVLEASHALGTEEIRKALTELTDRQKEVLLHLLDEEHVRKIAERLQISLRTVQGHRVTIYRKFGIHSFRQLKDLRGDIRAILEV